MLRENMQAGAFFGEALPLKCPVCQGHLCNKLKYK